MDTPTTDTISYLIVVDGTEFEARSLLSEHFAKTGIGASPQFDPPAPYTTVECELHEIEDSLNWITSTLANSYSRISITVAIFAPLYWCNFSVPSELITLAQRYQTDLEISFMSPPPNTDATASASSTVFRTLCHILSEAKKRLTMALQRTAPGGSGLSQPVLLRPARSPIRGSFPALHRWAQAAPALRRPPRSLSLSR